MKIKLGIIIFCVLLITAGVIHKEEFIYINIGDTYYLITYQSLAIFIALFIIIISVLRFLIKFMKKKDERVLRDNIQPFRFFYRLGAALYLQLFKKF